MNAVILPVPVAAESHEAADLIFLQPPEERIGFVAEAADGSVSVDNTLAARLARAEPRLFIELSRKIGDGGQ